MAGLLEMFGLGGGGAAAPNILSTQDLLGQTSAAMQSTVPGVLAYNQALAKGLLDIQLGDQDKIFGPAANQLQQGFYQSVLDELNLGASISPEMQDLITTNTLNKLGSSGVGASDAGKLFGARSLLSANLDLARARRAEAGGAVSQLPLSRYQYQPSGFFDPMAIAGDIRGADAATQEGAARANAGSGFQIGSLLGLAGTIVGGIYGGPLGSSLGGMAGGMLGGMIDGKQSSGQSGGMGAFTSLLKSNQGGAQSTIGGPQYGIGSSTNGILDSFGYRGR